MQIRCMNCHKPFALKHETVLATLDMMTSQEMSHYDAHCPHCRRVNRISRDELLRSAPDWKKQAEDKPKA
jgi:phage FluMu protein Com